MADHAYAGGIYSITIGTARNAALFGEVIRGRVRLSATGAMVAEEWLRTAELRPGIWLDAYVVMPTHMHAILGLDPDGDTDADRIPDRHSWAAPHAPAEKGPPASDPPPPACAPPPACVPPPVRARCARPLCPGARPNAPTLANIIGGFKAACTRRYRELTSDPDARLWHRSYYEHLIRGPDQLARARRYIESNPRRWPR
ncbi:MAG TPA: hypothetical protein VFL95_11525 [Gemmatimonadales bacterium]|nr:hypothetical protein [Gemmatimonadales bacterium]